MLYVALATGLALLMLSGDALVRGAVALALRFGIPSIIIGLTIVAFGTSAPELVVSLRAALAGSTGIAIGNVVGSNIANVLLVLGVPVLIRVTSCDQPYIRRNMLFVLATSILFIALCSEGVLGFWDGAALFALMVLYLVASGRRAMQHANGTRCPDGTAAAGRPSPAAAPMALLQAEAALTSPNWVVTLLVVAGVLGLAFGAHLTVFAAVGIAKAWGVSETAVGLTIVAVGTSLPELATALAAATRGQSGLALGNVLGSNIFNLLAIMGLTAMVVPIPVPDELLRLDLWVMLGTALLIAPFVFARAQIPRVLGLALVAGYIVYVYFVFAPQAAAVAAL